MTTKKKGSDILAFAYRKTSLSDKEQKAKRLHLCGKYLACAKSPSTGDPALGVMRCKIRLCPSCSFVRAHQVFSNVYCIVNESDFSCKQFIFLTLTIKSCRGDSLESEINRILSAWRDLTKDTRKPFRRSFLGTFRSLEITYNPLKKTYHPHIHAMAVVDPGYFKKTNPDYISHEKLRELWSSACGLDYLPQCRIECVKNKKQNNYNVTKKEVAEVAKYTVKSADYMNRPAVVETLDPALRGKRLVAYGGLFKSVKAKLNLADDSFREDETFMTIDELLQNPLIRKWILEWHDGVYRVSVVEPMKPEEVIKQAQKLSGRIIDGCV